MSNCDPEAPKFLGAKTRQSLIGGERGTLKLKNNSKFPIKPF